MKQGISRRLSGVLASAAGLAMAGVLVQSCTVAPPPAPKAVGAPAPGSTCRASTTAPNPGSPQINCAAPPSTFNVTPYLYGSPPPAMAQAGPTFDSWAWASFAAYNWPAKVNPVQPTGYLRGVPDLTLSFAGAAGSQVLVWETFKEKREVFNNNVTAGGWQQLTFPPEQTISIEGGAVPPCAPEHELKARALPGRASRRILQASKLAPALATGPHALDETAEVSSPAQEAQNALCAGYGASTTPTLAQCQQTFPPPPGGSGNTPYPPNIVNPRPGVGPRVFDPSGNIVYYEVRVNYDYFGYVLANGLNFVNPPPPPPSPGGSPSVNPPYSLPWRTSAQGPPSPGTQVRSSTVNYDPNAAVAAYAGSPATPPAIGSVQVKSAWRMLPSADPTYHTTDAVYFKSTSASPGVCYAVGTFGMIGLHIIQRAHMGDSTATTADPVGGTFIFATWEHNSIGSGGGYRYASFLSMGGAEQASPTPYPALAFSIPVQRQQPYPLATTSAVTQAVYAQLPGNSVWRNYRLVGTQFFTKVTPTTSLQYNQPYYMANLVVETNNGLQNFQGLPPNITPTSNYQGFTPTGNAYNPTVANVSFNGSPYNMGGCMGCHGVAQLLGSNFSFVLLDGQRGAGIDTATDVSIPPSPPK
jgi:hypothetical protein